MFVGVGSFWQRIGHRLFSIHSPAGLELHGCLVCGMPSREKILADIDEAYNDGLLAGIAAAKRLTWERTWSKEEWEALQMNTTTEENN